MKKLIKTAVIVGTMAFVSTPAFAATSHPAGGAFHIYATPLTVGPGATSGSGTVVLTGAIGDYGTYLTIDKNGKADPAGNFSKDTLQKGTFITNKTLLNLKTKSLHPVLNQATCSGSGSVTGPLTFSDGTGIYVGISATVTYTVTEAVVYPRYTSGSHSGQCNTTAKPIGEYVSRAGFGTASF